MNNWGKRIFNGVIFILITLSLVISVLNTPFIMLNPLVLCLIIFSVTAAAKYITGYISVALYVCKNE